MCIHEFRSASDNEKVLLWLPCTHTQSLNTLTVIVKLSASPMEQLMTGSRRTIQHPIPVSHSQVKPRLSVRPSHDAVCFARGSVSSKALGRSNLVLPIIVSGRNLSKSVTSLG